MKTEVLTTSMAKSTQHLFEFLSLGIVSQAVSF